MIARPHFSVIMPAYNCKATVAVAIDSVLGQTYSDFELIAIDDCSSDESARILESYAAKDRRVKVMVSDRNQGVALARNLGISAAKGRYITFLDSDDLWLPEKLEMQYREFCQGASVVFSSYIRFFSDGREKEIVAPSRATYKSLLKGNCIGNLTGAYDSQVLGKFYQEPVGHEDYLMWLRILSTGVVACGIRRPLARYRVGDSSLSGNKTRAARWTWMIYRQKLGLSFPIAAYYFWCYASASLLKRM